MKDLQQYRKQIDEIDRQIIQLLAERFLVVKKVWEWKKKHNIPPLQPERWQQVLETRKELASKMWINAQLIEKIWDLIHQEALRLEKMDK